MKKILVAAVSENGVIGKNGDIPWYFPEDMKHFKELTMGSPVVMGSSTFDSLPEDYKPLPGRTNIVLTRSGLDPEDREEESVKEVNSLEEAWETAKHHDNKVYIIGGSSVYEQTLDGADVFELTRIHEEYDGDTYFPDWSKENWEEVERDDREELSFITYSSRRDDR